MGKFSEIPIRNTDDPEIQFEWFNTLRQAGIELEEGFEKSSTIANNQTVTANIPELLFNSTLNRSAIVEFDISRKTDTTELRETGGKMILAYRSNSSAWEIQSVDSSGDDAGVTFSVTAGGQVQYTSTNVTGANYVGNMKLFFKVFKT